MTEDPQNSNADSEATAKQGPRPADYEGNASTLDEWSMPLRERSRPELDAIQSTLAVLSKLDAKTRVRVLRTINAFFTDDPGADQSLKAPRLPSSSEEFFSERVPSPREFLRDTAADPVQRRVAALAFYLKHFRDRSEFTVAELAALNREAGLRPISNITRAISSATKDGYLGTTAKGGRRLIQRGEDVVRQALADTQSVPRSASSKTRNGYR
jgi:hypothetical protein